MKRPVAFVIWFVLMGWMMLLAEAARAECLPLTILVEGKGKSAAIGDEFEFGENTSVIPGLQRGVLSVGGEMTVTTSRLVPEQRVKTETYTVYRIVNGKLVAETRTRQVSYTVYKSVFETRLVELPEIEGLWQAFDFCSFSAWSFFYFGAEGIVTGAGITMGETLTGTVLVMGFRGVPSGVYQVENSEGMPACE